MRFRITMEVDRGVFYEAIHEAEGTEPALSEVMRMARKVLPEKPVYFAPVTVKPLEGRECNQIEATAFHRKEHVMSFQVGDVVQLKSGGPRMTVETTDPEGIRCVWFDNADSKLAMFPAEALKALVSKKQKSDLRLVR